MTIRVGNCSGFYGDRLSAAREMLEGGDLDYLSGDWLAELTMLILGRDMRGDSSLGYARTFLTQMTDVMGLAKSKGVKIVSNAGGLNPAGLAAKLRDVAAEQGHAVEIAHIEGDDLRERADEFGWTNVLTANAYLGAFGIAAALDAGADIVVTGRVTDASVAMGPAISAFGWGREHLDELAGALVAGHIIECGTQATGGNFSGFRGIDTSRALGFPIAEIAPDGSSVITKHPGTGGAVTLDTVTAQLLYEVGGPEYLNPDVVARLDTVALEQVGEDRVRVSGALGSPPPPTTKVCLNFFGGFRNRFELMLTGLDIDAKAAWVTAQLEAAIAGNRPEVVQWQLDRTDVADPATEAAAMSILRCHVRDADPQKVGKSFSRAGVELALGSIPGFAVTEQPADAKPLGIYRSGYVPQAAVPHVVVHADGTRENIAPPVRTVS